MQLRGLASQLAGQGSKPDSPTTKHTPQPLCLPPGQLLAGQEGLSPGVTLDVKREDIYGCVRILKSQLQGFLPGKVPQSEKKAKNKTKTVRNQSFCGTGFYVSNYPIQATSPSWQPAVSVCPFTSPGKLGAPAAHLTHGLSSLREPLGPPTSLLDSVHESKVQHLHHEQAQVCQLSRQS